MLPELLTAVEQSAVAELLRFWRWAYPFTSAAHILGIALLFGAILPLDLRLLGFWRSVPIFLLARVLVPVAGTGLGLVVLTGPLLFSVDPFKYAGLAVFWLKLLLIALAVLNLSLLHRSTAWRQVINPAGSVQPVPARLRVHAASSALVWLLVILCGRLIAYV